MNRYEKFNKLGNAIRKYRGMRNARTGAWVHDPDPAARAHVQRWLEALSIDVATAMKEIDVLKSYAEMRAWMNRKQANLP